MSESKGIFNKIISATQGHLDLMIAKSKASMSDISEETMYRKSVSSDPTYAIGSQGYVEKTARLSFGFLKQMSVKNSMVAAIIQTYQNQIADFAQPVVDKHSRGYRIVLKNEKKHIDKILVELFGEPDDGELKGVSTPEEHSEENRPIIEGKDVSSGEAAVRRETDDVKGQESDKEKAASKEKPFKKAGGFPGDEDTNAPAKSDEAPESDEDDPALDSEGADLDDENAEAELTDREKLRQARELLEKRISGKVQAIQELVQNCGYLEDRPFEAKRWDLDSMLRAWVRDSLTYDQYGMEMIEDKTDRPHHWVPVDGATIRKATPELKNYKNFDESMSGYDILFPEQELKALQESDALTLDEEKLADDEYKFVQVVNGRIVRAFTERELSIGMRNPTTDIYANGYSLAELEVLIGIVSSHIFTENYNKAYFTQGFSAKGLLHIAANMPRRKLESFRTMWNHMLKGNKNSFQTPIIAGVEDVKWIPLTQNHSDIEFSNWLQYLIRVICAIYQIDPAEIGFGMKDMGQGGSLSGDNTETKLEQSKSKGLRPMLKHFSNFLNKNIVDRVDPDFKLEFVGVKDEGRKESIDREQKEAQFKKTVNEIRAEDGLPPLPGCDNLILSPIYFQWFQSFSPEGKKLQAEQKEEQRKQMAANFGMDPNAMGGGPDSGGLQNDFGGQPDLPSQETGRPEGAKTTQKSLKKSVVKIEHYRVS